MNRVTAAALFSVALFAVMVATLIETGSAAREGQLTIYCAAGMQRPMERIRAAYENDYGVVVEPDYRGSGTLLNTIKLLRRGDLYLAADDSYVELARGEGLVAEQLHLATMRAVIGVRRGNPKNVRSLRDLLRDDVRVAVANPKAAAIGRITKKLLEGAGVWRRLEPRLHVTKPTVNDLANDLELGTVDAAIVWDAIANQYDSIDGVRVAELDANPRKVTLAVLTCSRTPTAALRFARYLAARDRGREHFAADGFDTVRGDVWQETPELVLMAGGMLNKAVDDTISEFEAREGVRVTRVFNGCGILVGQMRTGGTPDAYFSCDHSFLEMVADRFEPGFVVSQNRAVIVTKPGNPKGIRGLADLARSELRIGLADPEKSALGALTARMLQSQKIWAQVRPRVEVWSPTSDFLVTQMAGPLDAVVVYRSTVAGVGEDLQVVEIADAGAVATQPFAIAKSSDHARTMARLLDRVCSAESRARFEALGFTWKARSVR